MSDVQTLFVTRVQLFLFREDLGAYEERGTVGCCVMGSPATQLYKLGCYTDSGEYICTVTITANNETGARIALQGNGYVSFKDEQGRPWSLQLPNDAEAIEFVAHVAVAMYSAAGSPEASIIACDAATGKKDRPIFANDKVKVRYQSWVVQRGAPGREASKLGSALESNACDEKPYMLTVPANHVSVTADMKGFEGMLVGACEESQRFIVIPQSARRGSGPNSHMCYFVNILKKKDEAKAGHGIATAPTSTSGVGAMGSAVHGQGGMMQLGPYSSQVVVANPQQYQVGVPYGSGDAHVSSPAPPTVLPAAPPPPPPGLNGEQLMIVDRMRDQIQALTQQLKEATQKLDLFAHDFKVHEQKTKPTSLASAQLEYTIQKMIQDTEDVREELHQRDITLKQVEERNRELQRKVDRFTATANQLADEKKSAISVGSEEKIDLDRRIAQLQAQLTRIQGEREDVARHLSTTKRLLEISDQDLKGEKGKFQIALVTFQTNESKLAACEETLVEERSRRKVLESKCAVLGDELRSLSDSLRIKDGQMDERRRKMEADKLHYTQLMEDERSQAASELRELRQELIDELAIRERRYQEERQRVAHESFERGRVQGVEDGHADALLEADQRIQELVLSVGRSKSEVETMKIRLRQAREHAEADQRRLNAQISALQRTVDDLDAQNSATDLEMDSLRSARTTVENDAFDRIASAIRELSRPIGKRDLLAVIHALRVHKPLDLSFEVAREREEEVRLADERSEVSQWVRGSLLLSRALSDSGGASRPPVTFPPMRTRAAEEKALPYGGDVVPSTASLQVTELPEEVLAMIAKDEARRAEEALKFDPDAMNKRYMELLTQMNDEHPELCLVEKKPPPPPPRPPTPPREPTPVQAPAVATTTVAPSTQEALQQPQQAAAGGAPPATPLAPTDESVIREPSPPRDDNTPVDDIRSGASAAQSGTTTAPSPAFAQQQQPPLQASLIPDSDEDSDGARVPAVVVKSPVPQPPVQEVVKPSRGFAGVRRSSSSESDDNQRNSRRRAASPPQSHARKQPAAVVVAAESSDDEAAGRSRGNQPNRPSPQHPRAVAPTESEGRGASPRGASQPSGKAASAAKRSAMFQSSDEEDDGESRSAAAAASKPVAPPKRAAPQQRSAAKFSDYEDSDAAPGPAPSKTSTTGSAKPVGKPASKASATTQKKKSMFADSDDSDANAPPPKKSAPAASAAAAKRPAPKKKSMFDSDDD